MQAGHLFVGVYHDEKKASKAVEELLDIHVPVDAIHVMVADEEGTHDVPLERFTGITVGAVAGGTLGAIVGAVGSVLLSVGAFSESVPLAAPAPVLAALQGIAVGAMAGTVLGVLGGVGHWEEKADLRYEDLLAGEARIRVHNPALQDAARGVFQHTHADRIDDEWDALGT